MVTCIRQNWGKNKNKKNENYTGERKKKIKINQQSQNHQSNEKVMQAWLRHLLTRNIIPSFIIDTWGFQETLIKLGISLK